MDLHIGPIGDLRSLGLDIDITYWCLSGHAHILGLQREYPKHINPDSWFNLNPQMIENFQKEYDSFLQTFDGFVAAFPNSFAMVYEKYNKPVILLNACRYDLPFSFDFVRNPTYIGHYHACLYRLLNKGLLYTVSNNKVDQLYMGKGCGIKPQHLIPSLCLYTGMKYTPTKTTFLLYNGKFYHPLVSQKPTNFKWEDIGAYRGVVHFPYEAGLTMSMFEHFTAGMPMFLPTKNFWLQNPDIQSLQLYWGKDHLPQNLSEFKEESFWIEHSCMWETFASPNTVLYDSLEDLAHKLETFEYTPEGDFREQHIESVKRTWGEILADIRLRAIRTQSPTHLCYNRLPLLANAVYDAAYSEVAVQHTYPRRYPFSFGDIVFVKTDFLDHFLKTTDIPTSITLVTGVSDYSPSEFACQTILETINIKKWIGCNITVTHPKIYKIPIGVGEQERQNGKHNELVDLYASRILWEEKIDDVCVPYHGNTHGARTLSSTLPKLPFVDYMTEIGKHKFVICVRGNGLDTHRVCETLLMGSVPVILHSGLDDMYEQFPCLLVDSFDDIDTSEFVWDPVKYDHFLDVFWLTLRGLQTFLANTQ